MRPQFHFTARGWINDPHGITFANGAYHLFFQYVPGATAWRLDCSWGHAGGGDLFSLVELPPALVPGDGDDGIWSGSLIVAADGAPRIFYTSASSQNPAVGRVRTATSTDPHWITWEKGPVVAVAPRDMDVQVFRDPVVIAAEVGWHMLVGAGLADSVAAAIGFSSVDGVSWRDNGLVASRPGRDRDPVWSGSMWECPQIIEIDGQYALVVSVWDRDELYDVLYALGSYEDGTFTAGRWRRLSYGPSPYAATTFRDADGRACMMFWLRGIAGDDWAGAHSLPYRIALTGDRIVLTPHPDLDLYRDEAATSGSAADILWPECAGPTLHILQQTTTAVRIARDAEELQIHTGEHVHSLPWAGEIRVVLDGPILEIASSAGVFACPMTPLADGWQLLGSGLSVRRLRQHVGA